MSEEQYHPGSVRPMEGMQGGMEMPHTQPLLESVAETNPRSAATENMSGTWDGSSLAPKVGLNPANSNPVH